MNKKTADSPRYAIYLRCSSDDQKHGDYTTTDTQREIDTRHVTGLGGNVVEEYVDEARSGTNLNRPGWKRLLADAQAGKFEAVCVTYMSRLARGEAYHVAEYLLREAAVEVVLVQENFTPDLAGHVNKQMTIIMDGMYPKMVSQWTMTKMQEMVAKGYHCGSYPFGYAKEFITDAGGFFSSDKEPPKRLVPHPEEAPLVRRSFELFLETHAIARVCEYLTDVTGKRWGYDRVKYLLTNEVYRGIQQFGAWRNPNAHEAVISEALWEAVQAGLTTRVRSPKRAPKDTTSYFLRGLVFCPHCGCRMTPGDHHGRLASVRYYECTHATKRKTTGCPVRRVNADVLHQAVLDEIGRAVEHPTRMNDLIREAVRLMPQPENLKAQLDAIKRRLRDTEKRTSNVLALVEAGGPGGRLLLGRLDALEQEQNGLAEERRRLEREIEETRIQRPNPEMVRAFWSRTVELWEKASEDQRCQLLPLVVERVEVVEKERASCRFLFSPAEGASFCGINSRVGSGGWT